MAPISVRIAGPHDVRPIALLRAEWNAQCGEDPSFEGRLAQWLASEGDRRTTWLAYLGARPAGMVSLFEYRRMPRPGRPDERWGYVGHLFVTESLRDQRIGTTLLDTLISTAEQRSYARLALAPAGAAIPFFCRAGFVAADGSSGELLLVRPGR